MNIIKNIIFITLFLNNSLFLTVHAVIPVNNYSFEENIIPSHDNTKMYTLFLPALINHPDNPTILWIHGYGKHSHYMLEAMHHLAEHGYNSIGFDVREHGRTEKNGYTARDTFIDASQDLENIYDYYQQKITGKFFIVAHSMGSLVAIRHLQETPNTALPIDAIILSAPCFGVHAQHMSLLKIFYIKTLGYLMPSLEYSTKEEDLKNPATRDEQYLHYESQDPLIVNTINLGLASLSLYHVSQALQLAHTISIPTHILMSELDKTVDNQKIHEFYHSLSPTLEKSLTLCHDMNHSLLNELGREYIFEKIHEIFQHYLPNNLQTTHSLFINPDNKLSGPQPLLSTLYTTANILL